ncbi:MAG: cupin domain-containing protein [Chthoniobacterales bacterium]
MKSLRYTLLITTMVAIASVVIGAEKKEKMGGKEVAIEHKVMDPAGLQWGDAPPGLPAGAKIAVLAGDPGKKGLFIVRLKVPADYKVPPHTHPTAEMMTVISGSFHVGAGGTFDESAGEAMPAGGFTAMPAGMKHYAWSSEESIIQITSEGPFVINYVNPTDDPRKAKK